MPATEPMKVVIKDREVDYVSDYPDGWKFSAGDPFKFPVLIGGYPCFIKRFEQKSPEDISGWDLLVKMTGKYEKTLSRIYDIKNVQEDDKEIYYVFYEQLDGATLDRSVKDEAALNLTHLNNDLFSAMRALQAYGFWFADFTEKNIFCEKGGTFVLVDVDSTQRITDLPDNDMYGSKDYWILVLKFYKEILNKNDMRLSDVNGISLNYLQIPFLVLRLKLLQNGVGKDYNSTGVFNQLPSRLNEMAPELKDIYLRVIGNGKEALSQEDIRTIEDIVEKKIVKSEYVPEVVATVPVSLPVISAFATSSNEISSGGAFTLRWAVENADKLELYKNGAKFQALDSNQKEVVLKEFADGTRQQSSYQLIAFKNLDMAKSNPIIITLKDHESRPEPTPVPVPKKNYRLIIGGVLLAVVLAAFFLLRKNSTDGGGTGNPPIANAGSDISIKLPVNAVSLEGKGADFAGNPLQASYFWKKINGGSAEITNADRPTASVKGLVQGTYLFEFKVTNEKGATASDTVQVVVAAAANVPPVADAGPNKSLILPAVINSVTLTGKGTDADGTITAYNWTKVAGPPGGTINPATANKSTTTVTALELGTYQFQLQVTDNKNDVGTGTVLVFVRTKFKWLQDDWRAIKSLEMVRDLPHN